MQIIINLFIDVRDCFADLYLQAYPASIEDIPIQFTCEPNIVCPWTANLSRAIPHHFLQLTRSNSHFWMNSNSVQNTEYQTRKMNGNDLGVFRPFSTFSLFIWNIPFLKFGLYYFWHEKSSLRKIVSFFIRSRMNMIFVCKL